MTLDCASLGRVEQRAAGEMADAGERLTGGVIG
jgi:hypothetical protein